MNSTKKSQSHLSDIMKRLNISGKELALSLHIDETLISKYKNNKRRLTKETSMEISQYIVNCYTDKLSLFFKLTKDILEPYVEKSLEACEKEEIISALNSFLLDFSQNNDFMSFGFTDISWSAEVKIYTGLQGRLEVQKDFFKNASGSKNEIIIGDFIFFDYENEKYFDIYSQTNKTYMDLINAGHKIILIITIDEKYQSYKYLIKWLQLYARDNIEVYCVEKSENYGFNQSIAVEKGRQSYLTLDTNRNFDNDIYVLTKDKACTDYYYNMLSEIKQNAHLILKKIKIHQQYLITKKLEYELFVNNSVYMLDSVFTYRNMPRDMLNEVLEKNDISGNLKETIIDSYNWWQKFYSTYKIKCIFDIEEINKNHKLDKVKDYELSAMAGRDIYIGKYQFEKHIRHVLYNKEYKNFKPAYYPFSKLELVYRYITMISQRDNILIMWSIPNCKNCLYYQAPSYIGGCSRYLKQLWESLPNIHKNKDSFFERTLTDDDSMNF